MVVKEVDGKWHTISKAGKLGKKKFKTEASAVAAQERGRALLASSGAPSDAASSSLPTSSGTLSEMDTSQERKALGIPPKRVPKDPEGF